jgi:hypothetical protein
MFRNCSELASGPAKPPIGGCRLAPPHALSHAADEGDGMKIGTILGVLGTAAAVVAIAIAAPARAAELHAAGRPTSAIDPGAWLMMLVGFLALGAMLRAARRAFGA